MPGGLRNLHHNRHRDGMGMTTTADYRVDDIVREVVCDIGYDRAKYVLTAYLSVLTALHVSPDIAWRTTGGRAGDGYGQEIRHEFGFLTKR
ncbi:MAG: hypothetical protein ACLUI3_16100 [Christensenellales bacterium]